MRSSQYDGAESHPAIIDKKMWKAVQFEIERRRTLAEKYKIVKLDYATVDNPFAGRIICGCCGSTFGRKVWNSTDDRLRRVVWRCNKKYTVKGEKSCESKHIDDRVLYKAFVEVFNTMVKNKEYFMDKWKDGLQSENILVVYKAREFIKMISDAELIKEFDIDIYFKIIEKTIVFEGNRLIVTLLDGTEIECEIR